MLPQDLEAERATLGCMCLDREAIELVLNVIPPNRSDWFFHKPHRIMFGGLCELYADGTPVDLHTCRDYFSHHNQLDEIGGADYLIRCVEEVPSWTNAEYYAKIVKHRGLLRDIIRIAGHTVESAYNNGQDTADLLGNCLEQLEALHRSTGGALRIASESELIAGVERSGMGTAPRVPIRLGDLGWLLNGGLARGSLTVIGGAPATGKTSLGIGLCAHVADATEGCTTLFISAEMTLPEIEPRLLSMRTKTPIGRIHDAIETGDGVDEYVNQALSVVGKTYRMLLTGGLHEVSQIRAVCNRLVRSEGVGLIVIDYLQELDVAGRFDRADLKLEAIVNAVKRIGQATKTAVVLLSSMRKPVTPGKPPTIDDLFGTSAARYAPAVIILLDKGKESTDGDSCECAVHVAKNRNGREGIARMVYNREFLAYYPMTRSPYPDECTDQNDWAR